MRNLFLYLLLALFGFAPVMAQAKVFEIFDGRMYNGLYYPMVDVIEWGEADGKVPWIEFHLHSKDKRIEVSAVPGEKNGKPVLWLMYDLTFRGEKVCRHVLAPAHFKEGMKMYAYRDLTDADYDNIYVSSEPMSGKKLIPYEMPAYERCQDEHASNMPETSSRVPASVPETAAPAEAPPSTPVAVEAPKKEGKGVGLDYDNHAVPFSF